MEFEKLLAIYDADLAPLKRKSEQATKIVDNLEKRLKRLKNVQFDLGGKGSARTVDTEMRRAERDIRRLQTERERAFTRTVEAEARRQASVRTREYKRSMNQIMADSRRREGAERSVRISPVGGTIGLSDFAGTATRIGLVVRSRNTHVGKSFVDETAK